MSRPPRITVVTPTHNRRDSIRRTMEALAAQTIGPDGFDAVVVADGCRDDTVAMLRSLPLPFTLTVLELPGSGAATARNTGVAAASGEILVCIDDDIEPVPRMLESYLRAHHQYPQHLIIGHCPPVSGTETTFFHIELRNWWHDHILAMRQRGHRFTYRDMHAGNFSIRRELYDSVKGFDGAFPGCGGEDYEFGARLLERGIPFAFAHDALGWHHEASDLDRSLKRARHEGRADVLIGLRHPALRAGLPVAKFLRPRSRLLRWLRNQAFNRPAAGEMLGPLRRALTLLEWARARRRWRSLYGAVRAYWYCRGIADELGSLEGLERFYSEAATPSPDLVDLDLGVGLGRARKDLDRQRAAGVHLWYGGTKLGTIPAIPGAEPVRGDHLPAELAGPLAPRLLMALAADEVERGDSWRRFFGSEEPVHIPPETMRFSVIIPAFNSEKTLGEALDSLLEQPMGEWEAIVVDDGSTDATATVAQAYALRDGRVRVVGQQNAGMTAARNAGLSHARNDWVIFLDADDRLAPGAFVSLIQAGNADPSALAIRGQWSRMGVGSEWLDGTPHPSQDLFAVSACHCPFAIHSCAIRRSVVIELGGFDPGHRLCADWDFWQRMARMGIRVAVTTQLIARYRLAGESTAHHIREILLEGLGIIDQGHRSDTRVKRPDPRYAAGLPQSNRAGARLRFLVWQAGLALGVGQDARPLVGDLTHEDRDPELSPITTAETLHQSAILPRGLAAAQWGDLFSNIGSSLEDFLQCLEQRVEPGFARRTLSHLERLALAGMTIDEPTTVGRHYSVNVEITRPVADLFPPPQVERVTCQVTAEGIRLGAVEVPAFGDPLPGDMIADTIAAALAWPILGRFFGHEPQQHDAVGWRMLLDELYGPPGPPESGDRLAPVPHDPISIEVTDRISGYQATGAVMVEWTLAGVPIHFGPIEPEHGLVTAAMLRDSLEYATGLELAVIAAREGLIGSEWRNGIGLRERLIRAAREAIRRPATANGQVLLPEGVTLAPSWPRTVSEFSANHTRLLGHHGTSDPGTSASRRAQFPATAERELLLLSEVAGEPTVELTTGSGQSRYVPELLWWKAPKPQAGGGAAERDAAGYDRHHFETVFARSRDPWQYSSPFERLKYEQTLSLIPHSDARVLELACAEGRFTAMLAGRVKEVLATDISAVALERARQHCEGLENISFRQLDFTSDQLGSDWDVIICSEALYYVRDRGALAEVARKITDALRPGGFFITTHSTAVVDDSAETGLDWDVPFGAKGIGEVFAAAENLSLTKELYTPYYRVLLFQRDDLDAGGARVAAERVSVPHESLPAIVAGKYKQGGGQVSRGGFPTAETWHLPILLYHRVADGAPGSLDRYRVTPDQFGEQMSYLDRSGFRPASLDEWCEARKTRRPLTGRRFILTFDDGYQDFAESAWPVLRRHGFTALVFLVTERVGGITEWTRHYGETAPLLDWDQIRMLQSEGISFGSHTATHPHLTAIRPGEVVTQLAQSRIALLRELGGSANAIAYPHGSEDAAVRYLAGACGYKYGLSCRSGLSRFDDPLLALSRVEVTGSDTLPQFIGKLESLS